MPPARSPATIPPARPVRQPQTQNRPEPKPEAVQSGSTLRLRPRGVGGVRGTRGG